MTKKPVSWQTYEEVARFLLNEFAEHIGVTGFEKKQKIKGYAGTPWEIDAKGVSDSGDVVLIVECRRHAKRPSQEQLAGLAYRIHDTGAAGGIIVTPLGIQKGAELVAQAENIHTVKLDPSSTKEDYIISFINQIRVACTDQVSIHDSVS